MRTVNAVLFAALVVFTLVSACSKGPAHSASILGVCHNEEHPDTLVSGPEDLIRILRAEGVPFPRLMARVAVVETGWDFSNGVGSLNNMFGMRSHNRPTQIGSTQNGYAIYPSRYQCIRDIKMWMDIKPPPPGMGGVEFLKWRGWNPFPDYWDYLDTVRL